MEFLNANNAAVGVAIVYRGKLHTITQVYELGVHFKRPGGRLNFIYYREAEKLRVTLAQAE